MKITEAGLYEMDEDVYHADPVPSGSLSSSGAKTLLPPSCPALFRYHRDHPQHKRAFDFGHAAHKRVLGAGAQTVVVEADDWRTKAAQQARAAAYAEGQVPLLAAEDKTVRDMADAIRAHPLAGTLLNPKLGVPERSIFWPDPETGVWRRARPDFLRDAARLLVVDYKTTPDASPTAVQNTIHKFRYHQQADWYLDAVRAIDLATDPAFLFVFQEKTAPYLVTVAEPDAESLSWGHRLNRKAIDVYRRCAATNTWPGYTADIVPASLPGYATKHYELAEEAGDYDIEEISA